MRCATATRSLPEKMTGGIKNPLGAMALYLGSSLYRIHGTNDAKSIGRAASSGCFRMLNGHVVDLASRVDIGVTVQVVRRLPPELDKLVAEQVQPAEGGGDAEEAGQHQPFEPRLTRSVIPERRASAYPGPRRAHASRDWVPAPSCARPG